MNQKKDIMGKILAGGNDEKDKDLTRELDCLIYRTESSDSENDVLADSATDSWKVTRDNVAVQVWETRGRIRLRVSLGKHRQVSMKQIANIAVDAILKELKKEE
ncbi:MAG: hypothetical protein K9K40_05325 [Desulfotignum sp.]|nr:hypothetical protein [Desulfotignum sp.]MCF8126363.1 hypothetical protein [Desulfotignum sp.]